jgi:uncharacterized SAM-binding protein YcdF (DUF218 family)
VVLLVGTVCLWNEGAVRAGRVLVSAGLAGLLLIGWSPFADAVLGRYEFRHEPVTEAATLPDSALVVVLGGGATSHPSLPPIAWLTEASLARLAEGVRLHLTSPGSQLLFSGAAGSDTISTARAMEMTAVSLGVDPARILLEERPRNTAEEAAYVAPRSAGRPVVLVTSASHMPRAVRLFEAEGLEVTPAPTNFWTAERAQRRGWVRSFIPSVGNVRKVERATYELLAGQRR